MSILCVSFGGLAAGELDEATGATEPAASAEDDSATGSIAGVEHDTYTRLRASSGWRCRDDGVYRMRPATTLGYKHSEVRHRWEDTPKRWLSEEKPANWHLLDRESPRLKSDSYPGRRMRG